MTEAEIFAAMPPPPEGSEFHLEKVEKTSVPHPFVITHLHVAYASDRRGGMLTTDAIKASGHPCGWKGCTLSVDEHENPLTLFIGVPKKYKNQIKNVPGLEAYLVSINPRAKELGIQGYAFPPR